MGLDSYAEKKIQQNEEKQKNERSFDVTLGYSITMRDVIMCWSGVFS